MCLGFETDSTPKHITLNYLPDLYKKQHKSVDSISYRTKVHYSIHFYPITLHLCIRLNFFCNVLKIWLSCLSAVTKFQISFAFKASSDRTTF